MTASVTLHRQTRVRTTILAIARWALLGLATCGGLCVVALGLLLKPILELPPAQIAAVRVARQATAGECQVTFDVNAAADAVWIEAVHENTVSWVVHASAAHELVKQPDGQWEGQVRFHLEPGDRVVYRIGASSGFQTTYVAGRTANLCAP